MLYISKKADIKKTHGSGLTNKMMRREEAAVSIRTMVVGNGDMTNAAGKRLTK